MLVNLAAGTEAHRNAIVAAGSLPALVARLLHAKEGAAYQAAMSIQTLCKGRDNAAERRRQAIAAGAPAALRAMLRHESQVCRGAAAGALKAVTAVRPWFARKAVAGIIWVFRLSGGFILPGSRFSVRAARKAWLLFTMAH